MPDKEVKLEGDSLQKFMDKAFENPDFADTVAEKLAKNMTESNEFRDKVLSEIRNSAGEVARDQAKDAMKQADIAWDKMDKEEQKQAMKAGLLGDIDPKSPKEIRDGLGAKKRFCGDQNKNEKRYANGKKYRTEKASRFFTATLEAIKDTPGSYKGGQFWKQVQDTANSLGWKDIADSLEKTIQAGDFVDGGSLVPEPMAEELIDFAYENAVVRGFPTRTVDLSSGSLKFGEVTSTTSASWEGENVATNASHMGTGKGELKEHHLQIFTIISNKWLRNMPAGSVQLIEDDLRNVAMLKEDIGFLRADGNNGAPLGLLNQITSGNKIDFASKHQSGTETTPTEKLQAIMDLKTKVDNSNVPTDNGNAGFVMRPGVRNAIIAEDEDNNEIYATLVKQVMQGNIFGDRIATTTQIPNDLGGSNDASEIYYAQWDQVVIGDSFERRIDQSNAASLLDEAGNVFRTFARDATALRIQAGVDILLRHSDAAAVGTEVDWETDVFS